MELNKIYNEDCLIGMKLIPDKFIDLIVIDPPYNINKVKWDKWKTQEDYIKWMGKVFKECERLLKDNGSFYCFHNDFEQMAELQYWIKRNTRFVFKQMIVWNKKFKGSKNEFYLQGFNEINGLRNYQKMAEYCLFYTFQDNTGLTTIMLDTNNFSTLRKYFEELQEYIGLNLKQINKILGHRKAEHCFYWKTTQWNMPTKETYEQLIDVFNIDRWNKFRTYENLRQEYENLRYTFNNQKTHHSVWDYEIAPKIGHITPKPIPLIENILKYSSNPQDIVLDCFIGSGTTTIACINTNRNYIGFELNKEYYEIAKNRINKHILDNDLQDKYSLIA